MNFRNHFLKGGPQGCIGQANKTGWTTEEVFLVYLDHLIEHTRCFIQQKILIIMDNHESHISLQAIEKARKHGVVMLTIPPHTSHRLQPLDVSVYGPFKNAYNQAMDNWLRNNAGKTVTIYDIPSIVKEAQLLAMTPRNIISGFQCTGIFPYNSDCFTEADFAPACLTDRKHENSQATASRSADISDQMEHLTNIQDTPEPLIQTENVTSKEFRAESCYNQSPAKNKTYVSPRDISALPKAGPRKMTNSRRRRKTMILTTTPNRDAIALMKETKNKSKKKLQPKKSEKPYL